MLNQLKDIAARQVGKVLSSDATMRVLSSPQLQNVMMTALNLRAEAKDIVEKQVREVASALELVTREDVAKLRRSIRDLEDQVADLQTQLHEAHTQTAAVPDEATRTQEPTAKRGRRGPGGGRSRGPQD